MMINGEKYITEKEVSSMYGISLGWIRKRRYTDNLPYHKLNKMVFFKQKELDKWFEDHLKAVN